MLVNLGCCNKIPPRGLQQQSCCHSSGAWRSEVKVLAGLLRGGEGCFSLVRTLPCLFLQGHVLLGGPHPYHLPVHL